MQLGFNLWAWTWCNISRPRKSGTLGGGTGGTCGTRCPGTFAFLEPKEFLEPVEPVKRMGFHRFQAFLGFKHAWFHRFHTGSTQVPHRFHTGSTQVPHRFHTGSTQVPWGQVLWVQHATGSTGSRQVPWVQTRNGSTGSTQVLWVQHATGSTGSRQVPWVQPRHWFHSFQTGSLGSNTQWFHRFHTGSLCSIRHWFHRFQTGSLGSTTLWVQPRHGFNRFHAGSLGSTTPLVPDRFFGLKHAMVPQVPDSFLGFNRATDSTGSRQVPWVQPRYGNGFSRLNPRNLYGTGHASGSTASRQVFWQPRRWFHRFHTGSLGSTRRWFHRVPWVQPRYGFNRLSPRNLYGTGHATGFTGSRQVPWVQPCNCGNCGGCESPNSGFA